MDNKADDDDKLVIGENVQRDIPETASPPPVTEIFDINGDNSNPLPGGGKNKKVKEVSKPLYTYMICGLIIVNIVLCISMGFLLYSEVKESRYIIDELNETIAAQQLPQPVDGMMELDKKGYSIGERASVIVKDADMNTDTTERNVVSVIIKNINEEEQIAINLVEITENSGVFTGKFVLMKRTDELVSGLEGNINDTIVAVYYDKKTVNGTPRDVSASANVTE